MYELKRSNDGKLTEELKLGELILTIEIDVEKVAREYRSKQLELIEAKKLTDISDDSLDAKYEQLGNAVISVFNLIFGYGNTEKILQFYENNYAEMLIEVMPYIQNDLVPKITQKAQQMKSNVKLRYKQK
jgi:hypothetical protein